MHLLLYFTRQLLCHCANCVISAQKGRTNKKTSNKSARYLCRETYIKNHTQKVKSARTAQKIHGVGKRFLRSTAPRGAAALFKRPTFWAVTAEITPHQKRHLENSLFYTTSSSGARHITMTRFWRRSIALISPIVPAFFLNGQFFKYLIKELWMGQAISVKFMEWTKGFY